MSSTIWTQCGADARIAPLVAISTRVVEAQHLVSTRKLVDSDSEQGVLERLIEGAKPPARVPERFAGLHYLLKTPFRYPPLRFGSRFGRVTERGLWYGAERVETALAEKVYYRFLLMAGSQADLRFATDQWTSFRAALGASRAIDLLDPAFDAVRSRLASPSSYDHSQPFGTAARGAEVGVIRFPSARDPDHGACHAVFGPEAFARRTIERATQCWHVTVADRQILCERRQGFRSMQRLAFERSDFEKAGHLPAPGLSSTG